LQIILKVIDKIIFEGSVDENLLDNAELINHLSNLVKRIQSPEG